MIIKIKKITRLEKKEDVYDIIGVKDNHNFIANNIVVHNCDLFGRGIGALYVKDKNPTLDSWRLKDFSKLGSYTEFTNLTKVREKLKKHPNFWQIIKFPKVPDALYEKYLKVRESNVYDDDNVLQNVSKEDITNALLILALKDIMQHDGSITMNRVLLHIQNEHEIKLTKSQLQYAIDDATQLIQKVKEKAIDL